MRKIFTVYLLFFVQFVSSQNTKWPFPNPNQTGKVTGSLGEFRGTVSSPRFHRGNDLKADGNSETNTEKSVHSINSGNISFNASYNSSNLPDPWSSYVKVNDVFYYHIWPNNDIQNGTLTFANVEDYLGEMITNNIDAHVHLQNSNTNYLQELVSYSDNSAPFFSSSYISNGRQLYKNGIQSNFSNNNDLLLNQYLNINNSQHLLVFDKIDITAHIKDYRTNPDGTGDTGEVSAFSLRWKIKNSNAIFLEDGYEYSTPPLNNDNAKYIFHHSSFSSTPYRSINIVTADPYESNTFLKNQFANLRLRIGEIENFELRENFRDPNLDSKINLQNIVKDNFYQIEVMGCDTSTNNLSGNCVSNEIDVVVDNFLPYIKKVTLSNTSGLIYEGEWNLNAMEDALEFEKCTYQNGITNGFSVDVETSETLENLNISIGNVSNFGLTPLNSDKTLWGVSLTFSVSTSEQTITFIGSDTAGNLLLTDPSILYHRINDTGSNSNDWSPSNPTTGNDSIHKINLPVNSNCINCTDIYEPNNTFTQASQNSYFDFGNSDSQINIDACLNLDLVDEDIYALNFVEEGKFTITLTNQPNDYFLELYSADLEVTSGQLQSNGDKVIEWCADIPFLSSCSVAYVKVTPNLPWQELNSGYDLVIDWEYTSSCTSRNSQSTQSSETQRVELTVSGSTDVCEGETVILNASGGSGSYAWYLPGDVVVEENPLNYLFPVGEQNITVVDVFAPCENNASITINAQETPNANAGQDITVESGENTQLQGTGASTVSWTPTTYLSDSNIWNPEVINPLQTITYTLTATSNGCSDTDQVKVYVDEVSTGNPPPNDDCSSAIQLVSNTSCNSQSGTVTDATPSVGANHCDGCTCASPDDYDVYYKFTAVETSHTVKVDNYASNFDAVIELRTSCSSGSSNYISCYDPSGTPPSVSRVWNNLNIGQTYYVRVFEYNYQGTPPNASTFDICVTHNNTNADGIDLVSSITSLSDDNPDVGDTITVNYTITNNGDEATSSIPTMSFYLSSNQTLGSSDEYLGVDIVPQILNAYESYNGSQTLEIPNVSDGQYYILLSVDNIGLIDESNDDNNIGPHLIYIGQYVEDGPDLDIDGIIVTPNSGLAPGQEVNVEIEIENEGNEDASSFDVLVYLDIDDDGNFDQNEFMREFSFGSVDEGETKFKDRDMFLPQNIPSIGTYELRAIADYNNDVTETDEGNNDRDEIVSFSTITPAGPDLVTNFLSVEIEETEQIVNENNLCLEERYRFRFNTENVGNLEASSGGTYIRTYAYLSKDEYYDGTDINMGYDLTTTNFSVGEINTGSVQENLQGIAPGQYFVLLIADRNEIINETNEVNNINSIPITIHNCDNLLLPDLKIEILSYSPYSSELGDYITVEMEISNIGQVDISDFKVSLHLSEDQIFHGTGNTGIEDNTLQNDGTDTINQTLAPNQSMTYTMTAFTNGNDASLTNTGIHYLFAALDEVNNHTELTKDNNISYVPIDLTSINCYFNRTEEITSVTYNENWIFLFDIETEDDCTWVANGVEDWIGSPDNITETGNNSLYVSFNSENPNPFSRTGHIEIEGEIYEFIQEARPCELLDDDIKISISTSSITNIDCTTDGSIDIIPQNGFPPYTYLWSNGETTQNIQDISEAGDYTVTISDVYCSISETFTVIHDEQVDTSVSISNATLISGEEFADSYQWIRCNTGDTVITGATNQSYEVTENGIYKVQIIKGDCNEESECIEAIWNYNSTSLSVPQEIKRTETYTVEVIIENDGTLDVSNDVVGNLYFSDSEVFDVSNASLLTTETINPIAVNGSYTFTATYTMPDDIALGAYYYHFVADVNNDLIENDEADNTISSSPILVLSQYDLAVASLNLSDYELAIYDTFAIEASLRNDGIVDTSGFDFGIYFSTSTSFSFDTAIVLNAASFPVPLLSGNQSSFGTFGIEVIETLPIGSGYIFFVIDSSEDIEENNEIDNISSPIPVEIVCGYQLDAYDFDVSVESSSTTTSNVSISALESLVCSQFKTRIERNGSLVSQELFDDSLIIENLPAGNYELCISINDLPLSQFNSCYSFSVIEDVYDVNGYVDCSDGESKIRVAFNESNAPVKIEVLDNTNSVIWEDIENNSFTTTAGIAYQQNNVCFSSSVNELSNSYCHEVYIDDLPEFEVDQYTAYENESFINVSALGGLPPYTIEHRYTYDGSNYNSEYYEIQEQFTNYTIPLSLGRHWVLVSHSLDCDDRFVEQINIINEYRLFPNPAENILNISIPIYTQDYGSYVDIIDLTGKKVLTQSFGNSTILLPVDVSNLASAIYLVHLYNNEGALLWSSKFIKE